MVAFTTTSVALLPFLLFASSVLATPVPLNINLGAYSPAIVVGDGAIEFDGEAEGGATASSILNAIQSSGSNVDAVVPETTTSDSGSVKIVQASADPSILTEPVSPVAFRTPPPTPSNK